MKLAALVMVAWAIAAGQSREELIGQQHALDAARRETNIDRAAGLYQSYIDRYGGEAVWDEIAKRGLFSWMIETQVKLENWESAVRLGAAAVARRPIRDEMAVRRNYAKALEQRQEVDQARRQRAMLESLAKSDLLAQEIREPARPLVARSMEGKEVSILKLRGTAVIVAFWATWCAPCIDELQELNLAWPTIHDRAEILAINTDDSAEVAAEFARKHEFKFRVFKSEPGWRVSTIPQLFVIDKAGEVRFHFEGFQNDDELFGKKIEWMIQAMGKP